MKSKANRNRFLVNFMWLFSFNNLGYLFSIITIPVLISKFGYQEIGLVFTVQAIVLGMVAISNYSLAFYIPTQSKTISDNEQVFKNNWNLTLTIRSLLTVFLAIVSLLIVATYFSDYIILWILSLTLVFFKIINPNLFFNALEKNKYVLLIGFFSKLLFLVLILLISDKNYVNLCLGLSEFLVVLFFLYQSKNPFFEIKIASFKKVTSFLKETFNLFLVNFFSMLKPASMLPLITFLFGAGSATTYTLADKIINMIRGVSGAMFTSFFPIYTKEKVSLGTFNQKITWLGLLVSVLLVLAIWIGSPYLIYVLNDFQENIEAATILKILSLSVPMFFVIIPLFSYLLELKKWKIILRFAILQLLALYFFYLLFHQNLYQIAIGFVISEYVMLLGYGVYITQQKEE